MLVQIGFAVASQQSGTKPALVWRMIALDLITDIAPDPTTGRAVVSREAVGIPGASAAWPTWELPEAVMDRIANAAVGAAGVLASEADRAAAQAAHDAP